MAGRAAGGGAVDVVGEDAGGGGKTPEKKDNKYVGIYLYYENCDKCFFIYYPSSFMHKTLIRVNVCI